MGWEKFVGNNQEMWLNFVPLWMHTVKKSVDTTRIQDTQTVQIAEDRIKQLKRQKGTAGQVKEAEEW